MSKITVLVTGQDATQCEAVRRLLDGQPDVQVEARPQPSGQSDPLGGVTPVPDVIIAIPGSRAEETLKALQARPPSQRSAIIVIGSDAEPQLMRRAMQAGARDYYAPPLQRGELLQAIRMIGREKGAEMAAVPQGELVAIINAKGGSGASFVAVNLAHIAAVRQRLPVALVDLDLQFGALPLALDLEQRNSLIDALNGAAQLDALALQGCMAVHASGVQVLSAMSEQLPLPWDVVPDSLARLLQLCRQSYSRTYVDLPRQIDPLTTTVLSQASRVVVVMQQSLAHVRDAKRMLRVLVSNLGVPRDNIVVAVNRHSEKDPVRLSDIEETVRPPALTTLPNDFMAASESLNSGVPILEFAKASLLTRALEQLSARLENQTPAESPKRRGIKELLAHSFGGA